MKTPYLIKIDLSTFNEEELLKIADALNRWNWPELLGNKPKWWDVAPNCYIKPLTSTKQRIIPSKSDAINEIMTEIEIRVGRYKILEWHWVNNLGRTKEEYRDWVIQTMADQYFSVYNR